MIKDAKPWSSWKLCISVTVVIVLLFVVSIVYSNSYVFDPSGEFVNNKCTDSDGGKNYFEKGTVIYGRMKSIDICQNLVQQMSYKPIIKEFRQWDNYTAFFNNIKYTITLVGVLDSTNVVIKVRSPTTEDQRTIALGTQAKLAGLDVKAVGIDFVSGRESRVNFAKFELSTGKSFRYGYYWTVLEYYCDRYVKSLSFNCKDGCNDGACMQLASIPKVSCKDSDGLDYYTRGFTESQIGNDTPITNVDQCLMYNQTHSYVAEHYCKYYDKLKGYYVESNQIICPHGCQDGACINATLLHDLSTYPEPFLIGTKTNSLVVFGENASNEDIQAANNIAKVIRIASLNDIRMPNQ